MFVIDAVCSQSDSMTAFIIPSLSTGGYNGKLLAPFLCGLVPCWCKLTQWWILYLQWSHLLLSLDPLCQWRGFILPLPIPGRGAGDVPGCRGACAGPCHRQVGSSRTRRPQLASTYTGWSSGIDTDYSLCSRPLDHPTCLPIGHWTYGRICVQKNIGICTIVWIRQSFIIWADTIPAL